jgi:Uri superfamily endonuclease
VTESRHQRYRRENSEACAERQARYRSTERHRQLDKARRNTPEYKAAEKRRNQLVYIKRRVEIARARGMTSNAQLMQEFGLSYEELMKITTG